MVVMASSSDDGRGEGVASPRAPGRGYNIWLVTYYLGNWSPRDHGSRFCGLLVRGMKLRPQSLRGHRDQVHRLTPSHETPLSLN